MSTPNVGSLAWHGGGRLRRATLVPQKDRAEPEVEVSWEWDDESTEQVSEQDRMAEPEEKTRKSARRKAGKDGGAPKPWGW